MSKLGKSECLYTIGHSNIPMEKFLELLGQHEIEVVVDVRSHPFSKYATHFNYDSIQPALRKASVKYLYLGKELGGMPKNPEFYDRDGSLNYAKVAQTDTFKSALRRLEQGALLFKIALMCGEENPLGCHRRHLLGPALKAVGLNLMHIRGSGQVQSQEDLERLENTVVDAQQLNLFDQT